MARKYMKDPLEFSLAVMRKYPRKYFIGEYYR